MPIYKNDMLKSPVKVVITAANQHAPCMVVRFADGSEKILEGGNIMRFINKSSAGRGNEATIGPELEEKLRKDFMYLMQVV